MPPYIIFSDKTLHEMCSRYPTALSDMTKISGVGDAKLKRYGNDFIKAIKTWIDENPDISIPERQLSFLPGRLILNKSKGETLEKTYELFTNGLSVEEIAKKRNLATSTITSHLERMIMERRDINIDRLVDPERRDEIEKLFLALQSWQLSHVIEHFKGKVSYDEAKFVRAYIRSKGS
ncbi:helix-turn-helix domain-containing protein [Thermodesulfovibrionales bacterium]|nr:helix-turn-helix domain-containing protein [Thermodesulfovibrionales bacterium]MCL0107284.1 helix-turn-helix domain-containing protein [Thermodesulfovibrionales bacterium]